MSKQNMIGWVNTQYDVLSAKDNKERITYAVAGIKDGRLYSLRGTDFGEFDLDAPDTEFITASDGDMERITGAKIVSCQRKMKKFFAQYEDAEIGDVVSEDGKVVAPKDANKSEAPAKKTKPEPTEEVEEIDFEAVEAECKKAIKKGKFSKAEKLLAKLGDTKSAKKLAKKLAEAQA